MKLKINIQDLCHYIGFINENNQKILEVFLFNYKSSEGKKVFSDWQNDMVIGGGEFWEDNTWCFFVNLENGEVK